ncbi:hypothetical protein C8J57DRAFT_1220356 [Mycena rebaudengoi]|nr:hypothetical protein C8J57DRAFT_1220356 [Mycena rebaudengoi]
MAPETAPTLLISNCGETLPLDKTFAFTAWATPPAQIDAEEGTELAHKNEQNIEIENFNSESIRQTLRYKRKLLRGDDFDFDDDDVGERLLPLLRYHDDEIKRLARSEKLVESVGPLPSFLLSILADTPVTGVRAILVT